MCESGRAMFYKVESVGRQFSDGEITFSPPDNQGFHPSKQTRRLVAREPLGRVEEDGGCFSGIGFFPI